MIIIIYYHFVDTMKREIVFAFLLFTLIYFSHQNPTGFDVRGFIQKTQTIPFKVNEKQQIITTVCIGTPQQCLPFKIVTNMDACFVYSNQLAPGRGYNPYDSKFAGNKEENVEFEYGMKKYKGYVIRDRMTLAFFQFDLMNFPFYVVTEGETSDYYVGIIGLGKNMDNNEYSFLFEMAKRGYAWPLMFTIEFNTPDEGSLMFGYTDIYNPRKFRETKMLTKDDNPFFETKLNGIIYENEEAKEHETIRTYAKEQVVLFSPGASKIFCPPEFFRFIVNRIIEEDYTEKYEMCRLVEREKPFVTLKCDKAILKKPLGTIMFIFGKWNIEFTVKELFVKCGKSVCFEIVQVNGQKKWIFGYPLMKKYPMTFKVDDNKIYLKVNKY